MRRVPPGAVGLALVNTDPQYIVCYSAFDCICAAGLTVYYGGGGYCFVMRVQHLVCIGALLCLARRLVYAGFVAGGIDR